MLSRRNNTVDKTGVDEPIIGEIGADELGCYRLYNTYLYDFCVNTFHVRVYVACETVARLYTVICEMKNRVAIGALLVMLLGAWVVWKPGKGKVSFPMVDYS